jgi:hypothetical protein
MCPCCMQLITKERRHISQRTRESAAGTFISCSQYSALFHMLPELFLLQAAEMFSNWDAFQSRINNKNNNWRRIISDHWCKHFAIVMLYKLHEHRASLSSRKYNFVTIFVNTGKRPRDYWDFWLCRSFGTLKITTFRKLDLFPSSVKVVGYTYFLRSVRMDMLSRNCISEDPKNLVSEMLCSLNHRTTDKVRKPIKPACHARPSEPRSIYKETYLQNHIGLSMSYKVINIQINNNKTTEQNGIEFSVTI